MLCYVQIRIESPSDVFTFPCCSCHVAYINLFCLPLSLSLIHTHALKLLPINSEAPLPPLHTHSRCAVIFVHWVRSSLLEKQGTCKCAILGSPKRHWINLHVLPFSNTISSPSSPLSLSFNWTYQHSQGNCFPSVFLVNFPRKFSPRFTPWFLLLLERVWRISMQHCGLNKGKISYRFILLPYEQ